MGVTNLIEDVWISSGHVCDDNVGGLDLAVDPLKNGFVKSLIVYSLAAHLRSYACRSDPAFVYIKKLVGKRHEDEGKRVGDFPTATHCAPLTVS
jgi:hypothetical protein